MCFFALALKSLRADQSHYFHDASDEELNTQNIVMDSKYNAD